MPNKSSKKPLAAAVGRLVVDELLDKYSLEASLDSLLVGPLDPNKLSNKPVEERVAVALLDPNKSDEE